MANPVSNHVVSGKVYDRLGNKVVGATITLTHKSITPVLEKTTNTDAEFIFNLGSLDSQWVVAGTKRKKG